MRNRLYINDGHGNFSIGDSALPLSIDNNSVIIASDFDNDGDQDRSLEAEAFEHVRSSAKKLFVSE
jgi:hypothetical protein